MQARDGQQVRRTRALEVLVERRRYIVAQAEDDGARHGALRLGQRPSQRLAQAVSERIQGLPRLRPLSFGHELDVRIVHRGVYPLPFEIRTVIEAFEVVGRQLQLAGDAKQVTVLQRGIPGGSNE